MGDLEVVAEHLVEPDLQRRDTGALPLSLLQRCDVLPPTVPQGTKLVEVRVIARTNDSTFSEGYRQSIGQSRGERGAQIGEHVELIGSLHQRKAHLSSGEGGARQLR